MDNLLLKVWVKQNFYLNDKIVPKRMTEKWFISSDNLDKYFLILEETNFLKDAKLSERIYCILNDIKKSPVCKKTSCDKSTRFVQLSIGYSDYCSPKCANLDPETQKKIEKRCLKKFGTKRASQSDEVKSKVRKTNLKKFGVENPFQSEKIKNKIKKTCMIKYGVDNPQKSQEIKDKSRKTCMIKYGVEYNTQEHMDDENLKKLKDKNFLINLHQNEKITLTEIANTLNITPKTVYNYFIKHDIEIFNYPSSSYEKEIIETINSNDIKTNYRKIISPYELDIFIPDCNLAIEFNGMFWHSFDKKETVKEKNKHLLKTEKCEAKNIQLLHIFENEWLNPIKQDIWKSIINSKLGKNEKIHARKCEIKILNNQESREFLDNNHLQGFVGSKVKLGLFFQNRLVSFISFSKPRFDKKYEWELTRFCNEKYFNVVGGVSKLFKYFVRNYNPKSIVSYADRRYSNGKMYEKLKFEFIQNSNPGYFYFKNKRFIYSRTKFQKHKLSKVLDFFDPSLTEYQNMYNNGYRRIWDCGNMIFSWNK